jgi:hypothetical protein
VATYDIVGQYDWTSLPRGSGIRGSAPKVYVWSYKVNSVESLNRVSSYFTANAQSDPDKFYQNLYSDAVEQEDTFNFPLLTDAIRSFTNTYGDAHGNQFMGKVDDLLKGVTGFIGGAASLLSPVARMVGAVDKSMPGSVVETAKLYQYEESDSPLDVSFVLSNTVNSDWNKNHELIMKLTEINRPERLSYTFMSPPRIYKIKVPGIRYIEWAACSNFSIQFLGTKREVENILVPEGYLVSMSFTPLTIEVNNFLKKVS